jgi:benzoate/toluate 1,2-dioxygenase subunit beta
MDLEKRVTAFVHREAQLLDDWQLDDWLALFDEDGVYWLPIDETSDPRSVSSIVHEDKVGLALRVEQLMRQDRISQDPRSETIHQITNVMVTAQEAREVRLCYNLLVLELRSGDWRQYGLGDIRLYPGRCEMRLRRNGDQLSLLEKRLNLLQRRLPVESLSFLL